MEDGRPQRELVAVLRRRRDGAHGRGKRAAVRARAGPLDGHAAAEEAAALALDPETGEDVYRIDRFGFGDSYSTPFLWRNADRDELIITGSTRISAYDPAGGDPLWSVTVFTCTTPTADDGHLYFAGWSSPNATAKGLLDTAFPPPFELKESDYTEIRPLFDRLDANDDDKLSIDELPPGRGKDAFGGLDQNKNGTWEWNEFSFLGGVGGAPGQNIALSIRAGGSGDVTDTHVEWRWKRGIPYVSSPLLYRDRLWLVKAGGIMTTLDAATGERRMDRERLPVGGEYYMSPVGIGEHVLVGAASGELYVLEAKDELSITSTVAFGEPLLATPAAVDGRLYVRTERAVWAF
ncbi:MAG: hypothetical protein AAF957_03250 [Planctomycetota bacterium]